MMIDEIHVDYFSHVLFDVFF